MADSFKVNLKGHTIGDTMDQFLACKTEEEARAFMAAYREYNSFADDNICFMIGFYTTSKEESVRLLERAGIDWSDWKDRMENDNAR